MSLSLWVLIGIVFLCVVNFSIMWRLGLIFRAFDDVILKTLMDTTMIERHKAFIDALTKFGENDRKRKDKEFSEMRSLTRNLETDLKTVRNILDNARRG